ncbi:hypothetical protein EMIT053CA3_10332 [Pseudomonas donghuensis]
MIKAVLASLMGGSVSKGIDLNDSPLEWQKAMDICLANVCLNPGRVAAIASKAGAHRSVQQFPCGSRPCRQ